MARALSRSRSAAPSTIVFDSHPNPWRTCRGFLCALQGFPPPPTGLIGLAAGPWNRRLDGVETSSEVMTVWIARAIVAVLLIMWLLGFVLHIAGGLIHLLVVVAGVILIVDLLSSSRRAA